MKIWRGLYDAYSERCFFIKPPRHNIFGENKLPELEDIAGITDENKDKFENVLNEMCMLYEMSGFRAGFKIALKMIRE